MADNKTFLDGDGNPFVSGSKDIGGVDFAKHLIVDPATGVPYALVPVRSASEMQLPDGGYITEITSTSQKWVSEFGGTVLNPERWDIETNTGGMVQAVAAGNLTVNMGVTANAELRLLSKGMFTIPFDLVVSMLMSQRIADNMVYIEAVEVDPATGLPVANVNKAGDWNNRSSFLWDGATSTTFKAETVSNDSPVAKTVTITSAQGSNSLNDWMMELRPEDVYFAGVQSDTTSSKNGNQARISSMVPSPNRTYKIRLRFRNGATAPVSATVVTISRVLGLDIQELQAQITGGRGDTAGGKAIQVAGTISNAPSGGEDTTSIINPTPLGLQAVTSQKAAISTANRTVRQQGTMDGRAVQKLNSIPELEWNAPAPAGGSITAALTTAVVVKTAAGTGVRNHMTSLNISHGPLTTAGELVIMSNTTVLERIFLNTTPENITISFPTPKKTATNEALQAQTPVALGGLIYLNAEGYTGL